MEAAGRGGAGKRAVRQRDPTWALRCPAFPSLKYYSVRREREPRSPASPRRRFHATSNALSPPPRHGPRIVRVYRGVGRGRGVGFFFFCRLNRRTRRQGLSAKTARCVCERRKRCSQQDRCFLVVRDSHSRARSVSSSRAVTCRLDLVSERGRENKRKRKEEREELPGHCIAPGQNIHETTVTQESFGSP